MKLKVYTSERYEDGLYLISSDNFSGLAHMEFLSENVSMKEYKEWYNSDLYNVIPLSDVSMSPQTIFISSIIELQNVNEIAQQELEKSELTEEDVLIPFIGGVSGFNIQVLLNRLWNTTDMNHYTFVTEIREYYKELFDTNN